MQEDLIAFYMGVRGVKVTYDPVFKLVFDPQTNPERLEEVIGLLIRQKVEMIQRFGYLFPGARCACYSSDLVMRQYSQTRARKRKDGEIVKLI